MLGKSYEEEELFKALKKGVIKDVVIDDSNVYITTDEHEISISARVEINVSVDNVEHVE